MNKFLTKTIKFLSLLILSIAITGIFLNNYVGNRAFFKLNKNIKSVVFGHSHPETAFNDSLITNFKNLAQSGESYYYTYLKAKKVLNQNPQIKNVFIEFTNNNVTQLKDKEIWSDKYINWRYQNYASLMNIKDWFFLASKNPKSILKTLPKTFKKQFSRISSNNYNYFKDTSGYLSIEESKLDSILLNNINREKPSSGYYKESYYNLKYLEKLVALCSEKNLNIYFIRSPLHKESFYLSNEKLLKSVKENRFKEIKFLDYKDFSLLNNEFRDLHHLNNKGARKFSIWFKNNIIDSLISKTNY